MTRTDEHRGGKVLLLNGPAGVGKTTVARRVAATARNGICMHGDDLKQFVVTRELGTVEQGLSYVGGAALADVFLVAGYELVVFEFVFAQPAHLARFVNALRTDAPVHLVTLWAPLGTVIEREAVRMGRERLGARVAECWNEMADQLPALGEVVDASGSVEQVVRDVCRCLSQTRGVCRVNQALWQLDDLAVDQAAGWWMAVVGKVVLGQDPRPLPLVGLTAQVEQRPDDPIARKKVWQEVYRTLDLSTSCYPQE